MDHTFKQAKYIISLVGTLIFFSIVVVSYVDSITCPMILQLATEGSLAASLNSRSGDGSSPLNLSSPSSASPSQQGPTTLMSRFLKLPRSIFDASYAYFPCNVQDLLLQMYAVWFIVFMLHKWIIYKREGWHYFMLDYCYFHNFLMIFMLLSAMVSVDVHSPDGTVRNHRYSGWAGGGGGESSSSSSSSTSTLSSAFKDPPRATRAMEKDLGSNGSIIGAKGLGGGINGAVGASAAEEEGAYLAGLPSYWEVLWGIAFDGAESTLTLGAARYYVGDPLRAIVPSAAHTAYSLLLGGGGETDDSNAVAVIEVDGVKKTVSRAASIAFYLDGLLAPFSSAPTTFASCMPTATTAGMEEGVAAEGAHLYAASAATATATITYQPTIKIRIAPARYALSTMSPLSLIRFVVVFVMFLGGTFGPILGAIVVWQNALLFHSFDKMTACYLHLAPALVQIIILSAVYETADMTHHLQQIFLGATRGLAEGGAAMPTMPSILMTHPISSSSSSSSSSPSSSASSAPAHPHFAPANAKAIFSHYLTAPNIVLSHVAFFLLWQLFYHVTFGLMALRRERAFVKKMLREGRVKSAAELKTFGNCGTNPTARVTAYTWMMASPPGGKQGLRYKAVCIFGDGELPTKVMFSVVQLVFHILYMSLSMPVLYVALKWREEPSWLMPYLSLFLIVAISNASNVMAKWIGKLQKAADAASIAAGNGNASGTKAADGVASSAAATAAAIATDGGSKAQQKPSSPSVRSSNNASSGKKKKS